MRTLLSTALLLALFVPIAHAEKLVEEATEQSFDSPQTIDGIEFKCLGTGVRKKFVVKVYAVAFCLGADKADATVAAALAKAGGKVDGDSKAFFQALRESDAAKAVDMRFVHDVGKEKIVEAFGETLEKALGNDDADGRAKFLALVDRDIKKGDRMTLTAAPDGKLTLTIAGHAGSVTDPKIAKHIWVSWIGPDAVTPGLRDDIAARVSKK
ncbi:MAG: chalcone isomerase family protein [Deltaproteobacteria bacterium]|nr:chalcone isomerase family protein [Deltaproteobacteria bacterium]